MANVKYALALALAACSDYAVFDASEPIDLVPVGSWTDVQRSAVDNAPICWNLGFGLQFAVTDHPGARQNVSVQFDDGECLGGAIGEFLPGIDGQITLCRVYFERVSAQELFFVIAHELGHAAGIRVHSTDPYALMFSGEGVAFAARGRIFAPDDGKLLADSQGRTFTGTCDPVPTYDDPTSSWSCACP